MSGFHFCNISAQILSNHCLITKLFDNPNYFQLQMHDLCHQNSRRNSSITQIIEHPTDYHFQ